MSLSLSPRTPDPLAVVLDGLAGDRALLREAARTGAVFNFTGGRNVHAVRGRVYTDIRDVPGAVFERAGQAYVEDGAQSHFATANTPRITAEGLVIEPERQNCARGSGLADNPAYWPSSTQQNGLTLTRTGAGVENGLPYADIRFQGTATASFVDTAYVSAQSRTQAGAGDTFTASLYARPVSGSEAGVTGLRVGVIEEDANLVFTGGGYSPVTALTGRQRLVATRTMQTGPNVRCAIILSVSPGATVDVTYRISGLQLEAGTGASTPLPAQTTARTAPAESLVFNALDALGFPDTADTPFTVLSVWRHVASRSPYPWVWSLHDGPAEELGVFVDAASGRVWDKVTTAGVVQGTIGGVPMTPLMHTTTRYAPDDRAFFVNGAEAGIDTTITLPRPNRLQLGGNGSVGACWRLQMWAMLPEGVSNTDLSHPSV